MPLSLPPTTKSFANKVVVVLDTPPAAATGIPTTVEVNAALFASLHMYTPFNVTPSQNSGEGLRKLGSKFSPTELGMTNYPAVDVQYSYVPQELGTPGADGNELYELMVPGDILTIVVLDGIDGETSAVTAGDVADVYLVECGIRRKAPTGDGEFDQFAITQSLVIKGGEPVAEDVVLAAA